ncbi:MAG: methylated-DNA--[protein]-cysteine S-methyltransferase [Acidobacteriota bacterium]
MPEEKERAYYDSPIGTIEIIRNKRGVWRLGFVSRKPAFPPEVPHSLKVAVDELDEYFQGIRRNFSFPLDLEGTDFQKRVWRELCRIPYGITASYAAVAVAIGKSGACRAVGRANHCNPIAIAVPCHRVVGSDGKLTGYGGGLWRKKWLLEHEHRLSCQPGKAVG